MAAVDTQAPREPGLWRYGLLLLPFGTPSGFLSVALAYELARAHVSTAAIAGLVALSLAPHAWKVFWAPLVDCVWSYKRWYWVSTAVSAVLLAAIGFAPMTAAGVPVLGVLVFANSLATTGVGMASNGLLAHAVAPERKGRAAGWLQAGNVGGAAIGGVGLWLIQHAGGAQVASTTLALASLGCILPVLGLHEPGHDHRAVRLLSTARNIVTDLWAVIRSRMGLFATVLLILPIGTGAASSLFAAVAGDWRTDADTVALVTGVVAGLASAAGSLAIGPIADRFDRKRLYIGCALVLALVTAALAFLPHTKTNFVVFTTLYAVGNGFMYALFSAVAFEAIGKGAAATKSQLLACAGNIPIALSTLVEGAVQTRSGSTAMLLAEVGLTVGGVVLFAGFAALVTGLGRRSRVALAQV